MGFRRYSYPGQTYFFTVVTAERQPVFIDDARVDLLRTCCKQVMAKHPFTIAEAVILPDHLHMMWVMPAADGDHSRRWRLIKTRFSRVIGPVWQPRYWEHMIRDDADWERHQAYIHWNPVKHGLVAKATDWPWSSVHRAGIVGDAPPDMQRE